MYAKVSLHNLNNSIIQFHVISEPPKIVQFPEDVSAKKGATVRFHCIVTGDSTLKVSWDKEDKNANKQKWQIFENNTLEIRDIAFDDMGTYVCFAENDVQSVEAVGHLNIECKSHRIRLFYFVMER